MAQQHAPAPAEPPQQAAPVQLAPARQDQVGDVRAVVALALHDEGLGPDHLLGRAEPDRDAEDFARRGVREPQVVHGGHAVARAEDEVDEAVPRIRLAQPVRERELGREAGRRRARRAPARSPACRRNTSRSFVSRTIPVYGASAWAPPIRNSTPALAQGRSARVYTRRVSGSRIASSAGARRTVTPAPGGRQFAALTAAPRGTARPVSPPAARPRTRDEAVDGVAELREPEGLLEIARRAEPQRAARDLAAAERGHEHDGHLRETRDAAPAGDRGP